MLKFVAPHGGKNLLIGFVITMATQWVSFLCFLGGLILVNKSYSD